VLKPIEIDIEKPHMKFLALNADFIGPSLEFLGSNLRTRASKSGTPIKSHYFTVVGQSFVKTVAGFSHVNMKDPKFPR